MNEGNESKLNVRGHFWNVGPMNVADGPAVRRLKQDYEYEGELAILKVANRQSQAEQWKSDGQLSHTQHENSLFEFANNDWR